MRLLRGLACFVAITVAACGGNGGGANGGGGAGAGGTGGVTPVPDALPDVLVEETAPDVTPPPPEVEPDLAPPEDAGDPDASPPEDGPAPMDAEEPDVVVPVDLAEDAPADVSADSAADGGDPDALTCQQVEQACPVDDCCAGSTCVKFPNGDLCAANCTIGDDCVSGCCVPLEGTADMICAPVVYCAACKMAGQEMCESDLDCCDGALCISESTGGAVVRDVCKDKCSANADCFTGCCAPLENSTDRVCAAAEFCASPSPPPTSTTAPGTYTYVLTREAADLYKVQGQNRWVTTQSCPELVAYDPATVVWNGKLASGNRVTFSSGRGCDVVDLLSSP